MGIRSDFFFAHKSSLSLPQKFVTMLTDRFGAEVLRHKEGVAYNMQDIVWYCDSLYSNDNDLVDFYNFLSDQSDDDFTLIEVCQGCPESTDSDAGAWNDNPWGAYRFVRCGIELDSCPD